MRSTTAAGLLVALAVISGCSAAPAADPSADPPPPSATASAERVVTGELLQYRRDEAARRVQVRLTATEPGLVVDAVTLVAPGLPAAPADQGSAVLRAGAALDFPVVLGAAACDVAAGAPAAQVVLHDDAGSRTVQVPLEDDGLVRRLHADDCADQALLGQAEITVADVRPTADGLALSATVRLRRVGGTDPVRVTGTRVNTVYDVRTTGPLPTLGRTGTATLHLELTPVRCDAHALGESYRTGILTLVVALGDDDPRPFDLAPPTDLRARIEAFAVDTCLSTGPP